MFSGAIIESHNNNISILTDKFGVIYFAFDKELYRFLNNELELVHSEERISAFAFNELGLWVYENETELPSDQKVSKFVDLYQEGKSIENIPGWVNESTILIDGCLYGLRAGKWPQKYLFKLNVESRDELLVEGRFFKPVACPDLSHIYVFRGSTEIVCFDLQLNQKWNYDFQEAGLGIANSSPQFFDDLVIVPRNSGLVALKKDSGEIGWTYSLENSPGSFAISDNGKIYCECSRDIIVLDALTGKLIVRTSTGYPAPDVNTTGDLAVGVCPFGDDLVFVYCTYCPEVKIFSSDGTTCLQTLDLWETTNYSVSSAGFPLAIGNTIFQQVRNRCTYYSNGLMVISLATGPTELSIKQQKRPPLVYVAAPSLQVEHKYQVYIDCNSPHELRRYAGIAIKELHFNTGKIPEFDLKKGPLDFKHNGEIELIADLKLIGKDAEKKLKDLFQELNQYFEKQKAMTSNGKNKISLGYQDIKKQDWDFKGEKIDFESILKSDEPIA